MARILLADRYAGSIMQELSTMLTSDNHIVKIVDDGEELKRIIHEEGCDILLLSFFLNIDSKLHGLDVLYDLVKNMPSKNVKVIWVAVAENTGRYMFDWRDELICSYLCAPYTVWQAKASIEQLVYRNINP